MTNTNNRVLHNPLEFILAGQAKFSCTNVETNNTYTYKVTRANHTNNTNDKYLYFVSVQIDNPNPEAYNQYTYKYIGTIHLNQNNNNEPIFTYGNKSSIPKDSASVKGFAYIIKHLITNTLPEYYIIKHYGKCGRCGRALTDEKSILLGLGNECIKIMNREKKKNK
jgi:hypothetical protein